MAIPQLSSEDRVRAAARATVARQRRAEVRSALKRGEISVSDALNQAANDEAVAKLRVLALLEALPGVGRTKAAIILHRHGIAPSRRIRGLGPHQRASLLAELG